MNVARKIAWLILVVSLGLSASSFAESKTDDFSHLLGGAPRNQSGDTSIQSTPSVDFDQARKDQLSRTIRDTCDLRVTPNELEDLIHSRYQKNPQRDDFGSVKQKHEDLEDSESPVPTPQEESGASEDTNRAEINRIVAELNQYRRSKNPDAPLLKVNDALIKAAKNKQDSLTSNPQDDDDNHQSSEDTSHEDWAKKAGFNGPTSDSILLAADAKNLSKYLKNLDENAGPRKDLENNSFDSIGIALAPPGSNQPVIVVFGEKN